MRRRVSACLWLLVWALLLSYPPARARPHPPAVPVSRRPSEPIAWARAAAAQLSGDGLGSGYCYPSQILGCGSSITVDNAFGISEIDSYACAPTWQETGPEDSYSLVPEAAGEVHVALSGLSTDLDVFLIGDQASTCHESNCLQAGNDGVTFSSAAGVTYYVVVDSYEPDTGSGTLTVTCDGPMPPANVQASDGTYTQHVRVDWDPSSGADYYELYLGTSQANLVKQFETAAAYAEDHNALLGEVYHYAVKACTNAHGCSLLSEVDSGYLGCVTLSPPDNVQASDGAFDDKVRITWEFPSTSHEHHFELYRATSAGGSKSKLYEGTDKSYDDASADPGITYTYWLKSCDVCGCSDFSLSDAGYRRCDPPVAPGNVQASDGMYEDRVQITWNSVPGAEGYEIYRATSATGSVTKQGATLDTAFSDTTATPGETYYYWVTACSTACGCSSLSDYDAGSRPVACTDPPHTPYMPFPPDGASGLPTWLTMNWAGGHPCPGAGVTYNVYLEAGDDRPDVLVCGSAPTADCDPGPLQSATTYYWQVDAFGLNGPVSGPVWSFTTTSEVRHRVYLPLVQR